MPGTDKETLPPLCDADIAIRADGSWWHRGTPIAREGMVRLFAGILRREKDGAYWLVTPVERCRITVEDLPLLAVDVERRQEGLCFSLNTGEKVVAGGEHPLGRDARGPLLRLWRGLDARVTRPAYYRLAAMAQRDESGGAWYVMAGDMRLELPEETQ